MGKIRFAGLFFFLVSVAMAAEVVPDDEPGRGSSVNFAYDHNPGNLSSYSLGGDVGLSKTFGVLGNVKSDQLPAGYARSSVGSFGLGLENEFTSSFSAGFGLEYATLPGEVFSKGFNLGARLRSGDWRFGVLIRSLRYTSDKALSGKKLRDSGIPERSFGLDIGYLLMPKWKLRAGFTGYNYGGATPSELSDVLAARSDTTAGMLDAVEGFPKSAGNLGVTYFLSDQWDLDLNFTRTKYELAPDSTSAALGANYQFTTAWGAGLTLTGLHQDTRPTGMIVGIQTSYVWD